MLKKFMQAGTKIILRLRAEKALDSMKAMLGGANNREDVRHLVMQSWQRAEMNGMGQKDSIQFEYNVTQGIFTSKLLPIQHDAHNTSKNHNYDIDFKIGFDDFAPIDDLSVCQGEQMQYGGKPFSLTPEYEIPGTSNYPTIEAKRQMRTGAEEEYDIRGKLGMHMPRIVARITEPKPNTVVRGEFGLFIKAAGSFQKPFQMIPHSFIRPHKSLKVFKQYSRVNEIDPEYNLRFGLFHISDSMEPDTSKNLKYLWKQYLFTTPGMNGIKSVLHKEVDMTCYFLMKQNKAYGKPFPTDRRHRIPGRLGALRTAGDRGARFRRLHVRARQRRGAGAGDLYWGPARAGRLPRRAGGGRRHDAGAAHEEGDRFQRARGQPGAVPDRIHVPPPPLPHRPARSKKRGCRKCRPG
jgi:hypothetical protein